MQLQLVCQSEKVYRLHLIVQDHSICLSCYDTNEIDVEALVRVLDMIESRVER